MKKKNTKRIAYAVMAVSILSLYCMPPVEAIAQEVIIVNLSENEKEVATIVESGNCGDNLTWTLDSDGCLRINGTGEMWNWSFSSPWYDICKNIKSIIIGINVTSIGDYAFQGFENLTSITIPDSVTSIDDSAFRDCTSLTSITIPDSVTNIGCDAFCRCKSLTSINIPDSVMSIGESAFAFCENLTSITIPDGVASIEDYTFEDCTNLISITIPDSVTNIGRAAFCRCKSLTSIIIPNKVWRIESGAFAQCTSLTNIIIPDSVIIIDDSAFFRCTSLTSITIPESVTTINSSAFGDCTNLINITILGKVEEFRKAVFAGCTSLTSITIPDSVTWIRDYAFRSCSNLTDIYYTGTEKRWKSIRIDDYNDPLYKATKHYNSSASTTPVKPEVDPKIEDVGKYLKEYQAAMDNYVKAIQNASNNDKKTADKLKTGEQGYLALKEYDQKQSSRMITFAGFSLVPKEAQEDTYEVLYKFLKNSMEAAEKESIISFDIDKSKSMIEIEASMVNKIYDAVRKGCESPDKGIGTHGYTVNLNICGGIFNVGFGQITITNGNKKYTAVYCSNKETVAKVMNLYQQDLCSEVKKQYKDACLSLWRYFLDKSTIQSITNEMLEDKLGNFTEEIQKMGYGNLIKDAEIVKESYESIKEVTAMFSTSKRAVLENTAAEYLSENDKKNSKLLLKAIKQQTITDKEVKNATVSRAMDVLENARKKAESALYDYIYDADTLQGIGEQSFFNNLKITFSCPVNVDVVDNETQQVVGYVHDGEVYSDGSIEVDYSYDMKTVILPKEHEYSFILTGTDEGTMQILYTDIEDGEEKAYTAFYDVPLTEGITYTQKIDLVEIPEDTSMFPVLQSEDGTLNASEYYTAEDEARYVTIITNDVEGGTCSGDGNYTKGDSVLLNAIAAEGYQFVGWYEDDVLISCQDSLRFPAMEDRVLSAKFEKELSEFTRSKWAISDAYSENAKFWTYEDDNCLQIELSLYTEIQNPKAVFYYSNNVENELSLKSDDGIHYLMNDVSTQDLKSIALYDSNSDEIATLNYNNYLLGDATGDNSIDILDVITLNKAILGKETLTQEQVSAIDFNGNGKPDSEESLMLLKYIVGLITTLI